MFLISTKRQKTKKNFLFLNEFLSSKRGQINFVCIPLKYNPLIFVEYLLNVEMKTHYNKQFFGVADQEACFCWRGTVSQSVTHPLIPKIVGQRVVLLFLCYLWLFTRC